MNWNNLKKSRSATELKSKSCRRKIKSILAVQRDTKKKNTVCRVVKIENLCTECRKEIGHYNDEKKSKRANERTKKKPTKIKILRVKTMQTIVAQQWYLMVLLGYWLLFSLVVKNSMRINWLYVFDISNCVCVCMIVSWCRENVVDRVAKHMYLRYFRYMSNFGLRWCAISTRWKWKHLN